MWFDFNVVIFFHVDFFVARFINMVSRNSNHIIPRVNKFVCACIKWHSPKRVSITSMSDLPSLPPTRSLIFPGWAGVDAILVHLYNDVRYPPFLNTCRIHLLDTAAPLWYKPKCEKALDILKDKKFYQHWMYFVFYSVINSFEINVMDKAGKTVLG